MVRRRRTFWKNVFRTVRSTLSRFLAIFAIVGLGVGFLAGLLTSPVDMRLSADDYLDREDVYDVRILSTLGLTDEDLAAVAAVEGVETVQPAWDTDLVLVDDNGDKLTTRVHSLPRGETGLNRLEQVAGRMPETAGECVVALTKSLVQGEEWIGQTLTQEHLDGVETEGLPETFTVVGTVKSAVYFSLEQEYTTIGSGDLGLLVYTPAESFDLDYYTEFYATLAGGKEQNAFGSAYEAQIDGLADRLEALGEERAPLRRAELVADAQAELDEARQDYADGEKEANEELDKAWKEIQDGEQELADSTQQLADAKQELDDGWAELTENEQALEDQLRTGRAQLADGYAQLDSAAAQLQDGRTQLEAAQDQLDGAYREVLATLSQLEGAKAQLDQTQANLDALDAGKAQLFALAESMGLPVGDRSDGAALALLSQLSAAAPQAAENFAGLQAGLQALADQGTDSASARAAWQAGVEQYEAGLAQAQAAQAQLEDSQAQLDAQWGELTGNEAQLEAQRAQLDDTAAQLDTAETRGRAQLAEARAQLNDAQKEYDDGLEALEEGKQELADGKADYAEAKAETEAELADARAELDDAQEKIDDIAQGEWYVFTRDDNVSFSSYKSNADKIAAIATVFPLFFFLVAALVALTTMTRMVEEDRKQIGAMKSLGYASGTIAGKYLLYAALASITGSAVGLLIGMRLFPWIIINAYNIMYDVPRILTPFHLPYALGASAVAVACTLLATWSACGAALHETTAQLLLPRAPKPGKRVFLEYVTPVWRRLKFTHKVTARNILRYKKRFFMTVIGIAGCTALLVTGFGLKDSISDIVELQFEDLASYQLLIALEDEQALEDPAFQEIMETDPAILGYLPVLQNSGKTVAEEGRPADEVTLFVPQETQRLPEFLTLRQRADHAGLTLDGDAVIISEKLAERQGLSVGDLLTVTNQSDRRATLQVTGICENYVYHYVYLSPEKYRAAFGQEPEMNTVLCRLPEDFDHDRREELSTRILQCDDAAGTRFTTELSESFGKSIRSINTIVVVLIISAGALAFVVLYNLSNINISEREKELATIKVLGFYDGEVSAYVYRETGVLTLIGAGLGLVGGIFLHQFVIRTAELDIVMFGRSIYPMSYVWSFLLTVVFSLLVSLVMHRKLKGISMVESLKAPE